MTGIILLHAKINIYSVNKNLKNIFFSHRRARVASRTIFCKNMCACDFFRRYQDSNPQPQPRAYPSVPLGYTITCDQQCRCFTVGFSEGYLDESGCRQGLAGIRTRWCQEHKDLDRFRPPECNTLRPVWGFVFPLVLFDDLEGSLLALI